MRTSFIITLALIVGFLLGNTPVWSNETSTTLAFPKSTSNAENPSSTAVSDAGSVLVAASKARAAIVAKAQPAVVHIKVERVVEGQRNFRFNNPNDLFNEEFMERFFRDRNRNNNPESRSRRPEYRQEGLGSGAIVSQDGYILTNNHVVGEADKIEVRLTDGREFEAKLIGADPLSDVAVIKIEGEDLPVLPMGDSEALQVGETVIAIGNPFGLSYTVTMGIVSAKGRSNVGIVDYEDFIQTDAAINPGNSGGPLINLNGDIVGVNTAIYSRSGGYQGIGFSVPIKMARRIMEDLLDDGRVARGWLGVGIQDLTEDLASSFGLESREGSLITAVQAETPAAAAGFQRGDVVTHFKEMTVRDSNHFRNEVGSTPPGEKVEIKVMRKGSPVTLNVTLGERPGSPVVAQKEPETTEELGVAVRDITPELANRLGLSQAPSGVVIIGVEPDSIAYRAGLRANQVIVEVNQQVVDSSSVFQELIREGDLDKGILLLVSSQQGSRYIVLNS